MDNKKQTIKNQEEIVKKSKVSKKFKIISGIILSLELLVVFRGPKLYGVLLFMITTAIILILLDKTEDNNTENEELEIIKKSINNEVELIKKSSKKLNYDLASSNKLDNIIKYLDDISEKYFFIKKNYGGNRGMDTLNKLVDELKTLENNLKEINNKLLTLYVSDNNDNNLNNDLDHIINQLDAQKSLNS